MGGAIFPPKFDCPHVDSVNVNDAVIKFEDSHLTKPCTKCSSHVKPWFCVSCGDIYCLQENHMDEHCEEAKHPISLNIADKSFWCFECKIYIVHPNLIELKRKLYNGPPPFTKEDFIDGLRKKTFKSVAVLTGAGISVAAGIPDFRTPGTGLYSRLSDLGLPYAEAVFQLDFFRTNPHPFYEVSRAFLTPPEGSIKPTYAHHFIKQLDDRGLLMLNFTQNIDGLELIAGLRSEKLVQAHGHMRTAHCIDCSKEYDMKEFLQHLENHTMFYCTECVLNEPTADNEASLLHSGNESAKNSTSNPEFRGLIKPDIVFFGESLPEDFKVRKDDIEKADLVIVMGTSLQVFPFASLIGLAPRDVPVVLINRDNPGVDRERFLFLPGDIQMVLRDIMDRVDKNEKIISSSTSNVTNKGKNSKLLPTSTKENNNKNKALINKKSK